MAEHSPNSPAGNIDFSSGIPTPPPIQDLPFAPPLPNPPIKSSPSSSSSSSGPSDAEFENLAVLLPGDRVVPLNVKRPGVTTRISINSTAGPEGYRQPDTPEKRAQDRSLTRAMEEHPLVNEETIIKNQRYSEAANRAMRAIQGSHTLAQAQGTPASAYRVKDCDNEGLSHEQIISFAIGAGLILAILFFWPQIRERLGHIFANPQLVITPDVIAKSAKP